ncbi:MAG: transcriptional repressor [Bacillota bacterium]|nr:transcriptional repressor [Bacillota bacterium]
MQRRNTFQKQIVLDTVRSLKNHATAQEIYHHITQSYPNVGQGTVYRNLKILAQEGQIQKVELPDGADRFDHNCEKHYHVNCIKCGKIFDVEMDIIENLEESIRDTHGIEFLDYEILFKGICPSCQE